MTCPHCQSREISKRNGTTDLGYELLRCDTCCRKFNERTGTPFNHLEFPTDSVFQVVLCRLRYKLSLRDTFEFGGVTGCFSTMEIHRNGRPVILARKEFKTLAYLIKNPRRVISRDELLNEVWGYENYPCTRTVDNHILKLRKKLESDPAHPKHFHTVHCVGYRFLP